MRRHRQVRLCTYTCVYTGIDLPNYLQDLYRFCCKEAQGCLDSVREVLADMQRGKAPAMTMLNSTPFLRQVAEALPLFCTKGNKSGAEAIKAKFKDTFLKGKVQCCGCPAKACSPCRFLQVLEILPSF